MKATTVLFLSALALAAPAAAKGPDEDTIERITGLKPEVKDGVAKVSVPRSDLSVAVDGVQLAPFQGLTTWAAFAGSADNAILMGDMTLAEDEVSPAMSAALDNGLEVTALHNHFSFDHPRILFMHVGGTGTTERLATGVRRVLDAVKQVRARAATPGEGFGGATIPGTSTLDQKSLEAILGGAAQAKDGMLKFVFGRTTSMHGTTMGAAMGVNTWAAFAGSPEAAVVDGDVAMLEPELQRVLKALRAANINVVAIHGHMIHEQPRIMFLHYWGKGAAQDLARAIEKALATQHE